MNESMTVTGDKWQWFKEVLQSWLEHPGVAEHEGLNMTELKMDQAYMIGTADKDVGVYSVSDDCFRCPFELQKTIAAGTEEWWTMSTARPSTWRVYTDLSEQYVTAGNSTGLLCHLRPQVGQFGVYRLNASEEGCNFSTVKDPVDIYMLFMIFVNDGAGGYWWLEHATWNGLVAGDLVFPAFLWIMGVCVPLSVKTLLLLLGLLLIVWILYGIVKLIMSRVRSTGKLQIAIVFMIFVNDGAGGYWWLEHATWNGLVAGDLVFPAFLWIMGVCVPLSVKSAFAKGIPRWKIVLHIRSVMMFLLGMSLNTIYGSNMLTELRIFGVLQRLAVAYLGACGQALKDVLSCAWCWALAALLVAAHSVITFVIHHPDCPAGYLGPGGKHDDWAAPECSGGAAGYIDRLLLGAAHLYQHSDARRHDDCGGAAGYIDRLLLGSAHLYQHSDARRVYGGPATDPEGLLARRLGGAGVQRRRRGLHRPSAARGRASPPAQRRQARPATDPEGLLGKLFVLTPHGKHDDWAAPECSGGAAGYIDRLLLGAAHLYQHSDARRVYGGPATDPEGLLGKLFVLTLHGKHDDWAAPECSDGAAGYIDRLLLGAAHLHQHSDARRVYGGPASDPEGLLGKLFVLTPHGKHDDWAAPECSDGAAGYIDRLLLGAAHLHQHSDARRVYGGPASDPEGLLGKLFVLTPHGKHDDWAAPECSGGAAGYIDRLLLGAAHLYQHSDARRVYGGPATDTEGLLACCLVLLSFCYTLTDAWRAWAGGPFRAPGLNAIALYVGHSLCAHLFPFHWKVPNMRTHTLSLLEAVWGTALWVIIAHIMAKKKVCSTGIKWTFVPFSTHPDNASLSLLEAVWGTALWVIIAHIMAKKKVFISL
ncbi:putative heparan-alpha-glucosaminide n-acetyltransferase [Operophtera brumata]|uniref:Putative heparan-alpha-glucosaminide n-acetyltransferase n=1 Tax=Operophtera brumata TaxID=104452 RepID=A0A0L7LL29_OPEBR|nr:putative heparan-alpha-glucosaminide n-acetyltransferase [Operophtera brumata]